MPRRMRLGVSPGSWLARSTAAGVIRSFRLDSAPDLGPTDSYGPYGIAAGTSTPNNSPVIDNTMTLPGFSGSLSFTIPGLSGSDASGMWFTNFADDGSIKFGGGDTFYIQWRQRFNQAYLSTLIYRSYLATTLSAGASSGATSITVTDATNWASGFGVEIPLVGGGTYKGRVYGDPVGNSIPINPALTGNANSGASVTGGLFQDGLKQADIIGGDTLVMYNGNYTSNEAYGGESIGTSDIAKIVVQSYYQRRFTKLYRYAWSADNGNADTDMIQEIAGPDWLYHNQITPPGTYSSVPIYDVFGVGDNRPWVADEWMTFQVKVTLGTESTDPAQDNRPCYTEGTSVSLYMGRYGQPQELLHVWTPYAGSGYGKYLLRGTLVGETGYGPTSQPLGKFILMPYMSYKDATQPHVDLKTWYSQVVISQDFIADPQD